MEFVTLRTLRPAGTSLDSFGISAKSLLSVLESARD